MTAIGFALEAYMHLTLLSIFSEVADRTPHVPSGIHGDWEGHSGAFVDPAGQFAKDIN